MRLFAYILFLSVLPAFGQGKSVAPARTFYSIPPIQNNLRDQFLAVGDRLVKPGKERIALEGQISVGGESRPAQITMEKGGKVRIVSGSKSVVVDGTESSRKSLAADDRRLVEALVDNSPETFLEHAARGNGALLVGRFPSSDGGFCDLYDVFMRDWSNASRPGLKRYCFDPQTALLRSVQYRSGPSDSSPMHETRFEDWRKQDGQAIPGKITHSEGSITSFVFQVAPSGIIISPKAEDGLFSRK